MKLLYIFFFWYLLFSGKNFFDKFSWQSFYFIHTYDFVRYRTVHVVHRTVWETYLSVTELQIVQYLWAIGIIVIGTSVYRRYRLVIRSNKRFKHMTIFVWKSTLSILWKGSSKEGKGFKKYLGISINDGDIEGESC